MSASERYADPILAAGVRSWMDAAAPAAAPERLVYAVMDEVERSPRRRGIAFRARPLLTGVVRYAILTMAITVGVAGGILLSRGLPSVGPPPTQTPAPTGTGQLPSLTRSETLPLGGRAIASGGASVWLTTAAGELFQLDPTTATEGDRLPIEPGVTDVAARANLTGKSDSFGSGETVWLVGPDINLLRLDAGVGQTTVAAGVEGTRVAIGGGAVWIGRDAQVLEVDPGLLTVVATFEVAGHPAAAPILVVGDELWVADARTIERFALEGGTHRGTVTVGATALIAAGDLVWAAGASDLVGLEAATGSQRVVAGLPPDVIAITALAAGTDAIWTVIERGTTGSWLVGLDPTDGRATSLTPIDAPVRSIAAIGGSIWTLDESGVLGRYQPAP